MTIGRGGGLALLVLLLGCAGEPASPPAESTHDHAPHHGGVVGMARTLHLEALAQPDGRVRLWLSDLARRPVPPAGTTGSVTLELPAGDRVLPLAPAGDALEARGPSLDAAEVTAHVELRHPGETVAMSFTLPVGRPPEAVGLPAACVPPLGPPAPDRRLPRCVLAFGRAVTALAATPDGAAVLVAATDRGVSRWRVAAGRLAGTLTPAPGGGPHPHPVDALAVRPGGREVAVSVEGRILRHRLPSGELLASLPVHRRRLPAVVWSGGGKLLASALFDGTVLAVDPENGSTKPALAVEGEATAMALAPDDATLALATARGPIALLEMIGGRERRLDGVAAPARALAFAGDRLVSAGDDGRLHLWAARGETQETQTAAGDAVARLASQPGGRLVASAGPDGSIGLLDVAEARPRARLRWHTHPVTAIVWAGTTLVSGDSRGDVALWDLAD